MSESSRQSRRIFLAFLAASVAAHAAIFGVLPVFMQDSSPVPASAFQVTLLEPMPLPAGPPEPLPQARAPSQPDGERARSAVEPRPRKAPRTQVVESPEPPSDERRSFAVGADFPAPAAAPATEPAAPGVVAVAPVNSSAAYLHNPLPPYPPAARRAGEQGTVVLRVLVTREGTASRVELDKSSGSPHLDAAARETVRAWRFTPARRGAEAVESWMVVPVVFRLEGSS
jgi:periplasmic protein TonB